MTTRPRVVLYGDSVFLAGIRAALKGDRDISLFEVKAGHPDAFTLIRSQHPVVLLFDLAAAQPDFAVALLRDQPELLLIGVDPSSETMLVVSGCWEHLRSAADLMQVITRRAEET